MGIVHFVLESNPPVRRTKINVQPIGQNEEERIGQQMMMGLQHAMMQQAHLTCIPLTLEDYEKLGKPPLGSTVTMILEIEEKPNA